MIGQEFTDPRLFTALDPRVQQALAVQRALQQQAHPIAVPVAGFASAVTPLPVAAFSPIAGLSPFAWTGIEAAFRPELMVPRLSPTAGFGVSPWASPEQFGLYGGIGGIGGLSPFGFQPHISPYGIPQVSPLAAMGQTGISPQAFPVADPRIQQHLRIVQLTSAGLCPTCVQPLTVPRSPLAVV